MMNKRYLRRTDYILIAATAAIVIMALLLIWRHRTNIRDLLAGTEDKIGTDRPEG